MWRTWSESDDEASDNEQQASSTASSKRKHLSVDAKEIVKNVYSTLRNDVSIQAALEETCRLTKIPKSTIRDIVKKPIVKRKKRCDSGTATKLDVSDKDLIRQKIYKMYEEQNAPTLDTLMKRLEMDESGIQCGRTTLWKTVKKLGFKFKKIDKKQVLMESQRLRKWRLEYLTKIDMYRSQGRSIIYLDETWYDTHDTPSKGWDDSSGKCNTKAPSNRGKRITIIHAGSKDGWVPNALSLSAKNIKDSSLDYHDDTTAHLFEDWFKNKLIPNIPPQSVIVMDNASYHSRQLNKHPCSSDTKAIIQEFMHANNIYFHENYSKKQLLEVLKCFNIEKKYVCDEFANSMGHSVLRLPPYHCIFNPIEHIWHQLKSQVRRNNSSPTLNSFVLGIITREIDKIPVNNWSNSVDHVIKVEQSYTTLSSNVKELIIQLGDDSDSDTDLIE